MKSNFLVSMKPLLAHEGKFSDHPDDPGGPTMRGITQAVYNGYLKSKGRPVQSVRHLTDAEYLEIYQKFYWDKIWGDDLPAGIDYCVFDGAVNSGPAQATKWLQRAAGLTPVDGTIGYADIARLKNQDPVALIDSMCDQRLAFMQSLKNWKSFKNGWTARVRDVRKLSKQMANKVAAADDPTPPKDAPMTLMADASGKARPGDVRPTETPTGDLAAKTGFAGALSMIPMWLSQASDYISLLTGLPPRLIQIILVVATSAIVIGGVVFAVIALREVIRRKLRGEEIA